MTNVLVVGLPRSGSSWLGRILGSTCRARYVHEPDNEKLRVEAAYSKSGLGRFPLLDRAGRDCEPFATLWRWAFSQEPSRLSVLVNQGYKRTPAAERAAQGLVHPAIRAAGRALLGGRRSDADHSVVKTVHAALCSEWIAERVPVQVVVVERSPLNVISSWLELEMPDADRHLDRRHELSSRYPAAPASSSHLERMAWQYGVLQSTLKSALERNPSWISVVHEEVLSDPPSALGELARRLGLTWLEDDESRLLGTNRPGTGFVTQRDWKTLEERWRRTLSADDARTVAKVLSPFGL